MDNGRVLFYCKGCEQYHSVNTSEDNIGPKWEFNGDLVAPTLTPSVMVKIPNSGYGYRVCHSFVTDGKIRYLNDCSHKYRGIELKLEVED